MASIDVMQVELHPNGKLVYSVRVQSAEGRMEFPIVVQDVGTAVITHPHFKGPKRGLAADLRAALAMDSKL